MLQLEGLLELIWFTGPLHITLGQLGLESSEWGPLFGCKMYKGAKDLRSQINNMLMQYCLKIKINIMIQEILKFK